MNPVAERCPRCGKNTKAEKGEVIAYCSSCKSLHEIGDRSVIDVEIAKFGNVSDGHRIYVPFWRFFCTFSLPGAETEMHRNMKEFVKDGNDGKVFVYVPAAELGPQELLKMGAYMTACNPVYSTTFSFGDVEHLKCTHLSDDARGDIEYYFMAAETADGRKDDLRNGFTIDASHEKLVFLPFYQSGNQFNPAV
ncbi:MAG: hypothetical protein KIY11_03030 [Thermoplasmata archaeon]|nr:hypothetical protein [Candidatus Sysuiplasma acidicola]